MILCTDLHYNKSNYLEVTKVLRQCLELCVEKTSNLYILGDLNDTKAIVRAEFINEISNLFEEYPDVTKHILVGNHDLINVKNDRIHSLEFLRYLPNTKVYDNTMGVHQRIIEDNVKVGMIPYKNDLEELKNELSNFKDRGVTTLFLHQGISGSLKTASIKDTSGLDNTLLSDFKCYVGHYHLSHKVSDNIYYIGATLSKDFGEANQDKFIWHINELGMHEKIPTNCRLHKVLTLTEDTELCLDNIKSDDYLRVILKGTKSWISSLDIKELESKLPEGAEIRPLYEDTTQINKTSLNKESPIVVLQSFIEDQSITDYAKKSLLKKVDKVCSIL